MLPSLSKASTAVLPNSIRNRMPETSTAAATNHSSTSAPILTTTSAAAIATVLMSTPTINKAYRYEKEKGQSSEIRNSIIAGSMAGVVSCVIFHPFDVVRTKMQTAMFANSKSIASAGAGSFTVSKGPIYVLTNTMKNGGVRALYTGLSLPATAQALYKSTIFTTNRVTKNALLDYRFNNADGHKQEGRSSMPSNQFSFRDHFMCGALSGAVNAMLFVSPVEYVRSQLIAQHTRLVQKAKSSSNSSKFITKRMFGPTDVVRTVMNKDPRGIFGLWRGGVVTLCRDSIGCGTFFISFEFGKTIMPSITGKEDKDALANTIGSGLMAGFGYWIVSLPMDSVKTLIQSGHAKSAVHALSVIFKREGFFGTAVKLYRGWQVALGRGSPAAAVSLSTYSMVYQLCERTFD